MTSTRLLASDSTADTDHIQTSNEIGPNDDANITQEDGSEEEIEVLQPILRQTMEIRFDPQDSTFQRPLTTQNNNQTADKPASSSFNLSSQSSSSSSSSSSLSSKRKTSKINGRHRNSRWKSKTGSASASQPPRNPPPKVKRKLQCLLLGAAGAGKTSIMRRYFHRNFEAGTRVPTLGSDFYIGRVTLPLWNSKSTDGEQNKSSSRNKKKEINNDQQTSDNEQRGRENAEMNQTDSFQKTNSNGRRRERQRKQSSSSTNNNNHDTDSVTVNLQMWDTPGRERFYLKRNKRRFTVSLSDDFFQHADCIMLVYDMCSSTSFTQLLRWYADLLEIPHRLPILIVGNKLDLYKAEQDRATVVVHPRRVPQRNIMKLGRDFKGSDFRYEYQVDKSMNKNSTASNESIATKKSKKSSSSSKHHHSANPHHPENIFFLANRENWTTDNSYLDSLLNSEDASSPDRDMVLLWCMRNGLQHMEVSAATGEGIDEAIQSMLQLAMISQPQTVENQTSTKEKETPKPTIEPKDNPSSSWLQVSHRRSLEEVDFQDRYANREEPPCCFWFRPLPQWFK